MSRVPPAFPLPHAVPWPSFPLRLPPLFSLYERSAPFTPLPRRTLPLPPLALALAARHKSTRRDEPQRSLLSLCRHARASALAEADAQANFAEPAAPLEYNSNSVYRNDLTKHTRKMLDPQQQFRKPLTTSQEVGWDLTKDQMPGHPFHLKTSATTQFADAAEKQAWGRSIGGEFSEFATRKLLEFGGFGMGV